MPTRYAIYYAPEPDSALAAFGAAWLGWDAARGEEVAHPEMEALPRPVSELTAAPRKYGFHATLKAPFRLAEGRDEGGLRAATADLAARLAPVEAAGLGLSRLAGFVALIPAGDAAPLRRLAARVVAELDAFRAPPGPDELARRRAAGLSARQEALLARWGYPYVMKEFRLHLTLTARLPETEARAVEAALAPRLAPILPAPFRLGAICLCAEGADGRFRVLHRYALSG